MDCAALPARVMTEARGDSGSDMLSRENPVNYAHRQRDLPRESIYISLKVLRKTSALENVISCVWKTVTHVKRLVNLPRGVCTTLEEQSFPKHRRLFA